MKNIKLIQRDKFYILKWMDWLAISITVGKLFGVTTNNGKDHKPVNTLQMHLKIS